MRYENADFIGQADMDAGVILVNVQAVDNAKAFEKAVAKVVGKATAQASAAGSAGLGRGRDQYTPFVTVYGLAQCTRDLAPLACAQCLSTAVSRFGGYCGARQGCQINYSSCRVRYEIYPFYFPLAGDGRRAVTDMTKNTKIVVHP
ncbi:hypothetical protein PVAP13_9NG696500 [Panicum virgatum]|uniref:Gnk2-homologous domain-containing protein n=2 Tax=Panicum virgatum TaxID=38727 RepID=A0A8T0N178_PANVG|nr:hypothetical protein PVAP13_9NG696500 [Panicum virgatum]